MTKDFINPEAAWPQIDRLRVETEAKGFQLRERLAIYPEFIACAEFLSGRVREKLNALVDANGFAILGDAPLGGANPRVRRPEL